MKNWQKNRNYKRVKDKDGNVVANIITVFGQDVEVSDEIFATYAQVDRRARYVGGIFRRSTNFRWNSLKKKVYHLKS